MRRFVFWLIVAAAFVVVGLAIVGKLDDAVATILMALFGAAAGAAKVVPAAAGAIVNEVAKGAGAQPIPKNNQGKPRRPGPSAVSPKPEDGKKRARPLRNRGRM